MSDPAIATDAARLQELEAVTKEYAKYSRTAFGLAGAWVGAWLLLAAAIGFVWSGPGVHLVSAMPLVWLWAVARARAHYQRHGAVIEEEEVPFPLWSHESGRRFFLGLTYFFCVMGIVEGSTSGRGSLLVSAAIFVAIPAAAARVTKGIQDASLTCALTMVAAQARLTMEFRPLAHVTLAVLALGYAAGGAWQHGKYRRLERRLAALKGAA